MGVFCVITANSGIISSVFLHKNFCYGYSVNLPHEMVLISTPNTYLEKIIPKYSSHMLL